MVFSSSRRQPGIGLRQVAGPEAAAAAVVQELVELVERCTAQGRPCVVGFATGRSMLAVYEALVERVRKGELDPARMRSFNLDEYLDLAPDDPRSFRAFMQRHWIGPGQVDPTWVALPGVPGCGTGSEADGEAYERAIERAGGLDLLYLGLGRNGHIAFNEPGATRDSRTRVVELASETRRDAVPAFGSLDQVPKRAITMGIATILSARRLRVLAFGEAKAAAVAATLVGEPQESWPCSFLAGHPDVQLLVDPAAAG